MFTTHPFLDVAVVFFLFCILQYKARYAMNGIIVTIAILEGIVAIIASTLGCRSLCCGGPSEVHCNFFASDNWRVLFRLPHSSLQMFQTNIGLKVKSRINSTPQLLWTLHSKRIWNFSDAFIFQIPSLWFAFLVLFVLCHIRVPMQKETNREVRRLWKTQFYDGI